MGIPLCVICCFSLACFLGSSISSPRILSIWSDDSFNEIRFSIMLKQWLQNIYHQKIMFNKTKNMHLLALGSFWLNVVICWRLLYHKGHWHVVSLASVIFWHQFSSVTQSCPKLCDPMNISTPGLHVHHQLLEFTQAHVHRVGDAIQPSHSLSPPSPSAPNPSQHQSLFQWVNSSHEVAKVLEFQL